MPKVTLEEVHDKIEDMIDRQSKLENLFLRLLRSIDAMNIQDKLTK